MQFLLSGWLVHFVSVLFAAGFFAAPGALSLPGQYSASKLPFQPLLPSHRRRFLRASRLMGNREQVSKGWSPDPRAQVLSHKDSLEKASRDTGSVPGRTAVTTNSTQSQCTLSVPRQALPGRIDDTSFHPQSDPKAIMTTVRRLRQRTALKRKK